MKLYLFRHGQTKGNKEHRYVGITDEGLLTESIEQLKQKVRTKGIPEVDRIYVSPRKRCLETAKLLYPSAFKDARYCIVEELDECDFGIFEYRNYEELKGNPDYQLFIDSMGKSGFPDGETMEAFQERCLRGLEKVFADLNGGEKAIALIVHGGTIMSILDRYSMPHKDYYEWQVGNGCGYEAEVVGGNNGKIQCTDIRKL